MKSIIHKMTSLLMTILLLLSTTSWKVEKHYCMGHLMDVALFTDVDTCGMNMSTVDTTEALNKSENSCCNDEIIFVEGQDDLKLSFNDLDTDQQSFLIAFKYSYSHIFQAQTDQFVPHDQYPPPILVKDIQLFDEVYLI
jgi:hypothetical protein